MHFDVQVIIKTIPYLTRGLLNTLLLTFLGIILSSVLALVCTPLRMSPNRFLKSFFPTYIDIFRITPIVAQIFYLYFALPLIGIKVSAFGCGLIALVLHYNAYNIEVLRSGMEAVPSWVSMKLEWPWGLPTSKGCDLSSSLSLFASAFLPWSTMMFPF